jgi:uncharacterized protein with FMN-binding domain
MSKSNLFFFAATLALFGMAVLTGHPPWGAVTGISILLTAAAMAAGALTGKTSPAAEASEQITASRKIPAGLVTLSASAILAVYVAGYQRTRSAADQFEAQTARHQSTASVAAVIMPPAPLNSAVGVPSAIQTPAAPRRKAIATKPPAAKTPNAAPQPEAASEPPAVASTTPVGPGNEPPPSPAAPPVAKAQASYKDGTFAGWGSCRHGSIQASVVIESGQIVATQITQCLTRYPCSWIAKLPGQVVTRQSATVDYVSGATESTDAFYDAISSALAAARE